MALPGCDRFKYRTKTVITDPIDERAIFGANPDRAVLTISNNSSSAPAKIGFRGLGDVDVIQWVQVKDHETWVYELHKLLVTAEIVALGPGFALTLVCSEQVYGG